MALMDLQIAQLQVRHRMTLPSPPALPLRDAVDHDVIVEGFAATHDLDLSRCSIAPFALSWSTDPLPPLLYRHLPDQVAGKIEALAFDHQGRIRIKARVEHPEAKRCAGFSVGFKVEQFEIVNPDSAVSFHSLVKKGVVTEVSLTDIPCNRFAVVECRYRAPPSYDDAFAAVARMQKLLDALATPPAPEPAQYEIKAGPAFIHGKMPFARMKRRPTEFSSLVARLHTGENA